MSFIACAQLVENGDPDRFLAVMSCAPEDRAVLFPLYAFNLEVARAPWVTKEEMIAEMRLQFWRDTLEDIGQGKEPRAHEVAAPLQELLRDRREVLPVLDALIEARRWDIYSDPFADEAVFEAHIEAVSGNLAWASALCFGAPDALEAPIRDAAWAGGLAGWFAAIPSLEERGKRPLVDGRAEAVLALANKGLARLKSARDQDFGAATPAIRQFWQAKSLLTQVVRDPLCVVDGRMGLSDFRKRALLLYKSTVSGW